LICKKRR